MAGYPCPSIIPTDWFARCFLRSRTSRQEFAAEIDGSNVAASVCGFGKLTGRKRQKRYARRDPIWVAHASRVLAMTSRHRGLFEKLFWRDAKTNTRGACATRNQNSTRARPIDSA